MPSQVGNLLREPGHWIDQVLQLDGDPHQFLHIENSTSATLTHVLKHAKRRAPSACVLLPY